MVSMLSSISTVTLRINFNLVEFIFTFFAHATRHVGS